MCKEGERWEITCVDNLLTTTNKRKTLASIENEVCNRPNSSEAQCVFLFCIF